MARALKRYSNEENKEYFKKHEIDEKDSLLVHNKKGKQIVFNLLDRFDDPVEIYKSYEDELKTHEIDNKAEFMCHYYSYLDSKDKVIDNADLAINFAKSGTEIADRLKLLEVPFVYNVAIELNRIIDKKLKMFETTVNLVIWSIITLLVSTGYGYSIESLNSTYSVFETLILFGAMYMLAYWTMKTGDGIIAKTVHKLAKPCRKILLGFSSIQEDTDDLFEYIKEYERWNYRHRFFTDKFYSGTVQNAKDLIMNSNSDLSNDVTCAKLSDLNPAIQGEEYIWETFKTFKFAEVFVGSSWRFRYLSSIKIDESIKTVDDAVRVRNSIKDEYSGVAMLDAELNRGYSAVFKAICFNKNFYIQCADIDSTSIWTFMYGCIGAILHLIIDLNNHPESAANLFAMASMLGFIMIHENHLKALKSVRPLSNDQNVHSDITKYIKYSDIADAAEFKFTDKNIEEPIESKSNLLVEAKSSTKFGKNNVKAGHKQSKKNVKQAKLSADNIEAIKNPENKIYFDGNYISTNERITRCLNIEILKVKGNKYQENKNDEFRVRLANIKSKLNSLANILEHEDSYLPHDVELCKKFYRIYLPGIANSFDNIKQLNEDNIKEEYLKKLLVTIEDILDGILDAIDESVKLNIDVELDTLEKLKELHGIVSSL